jgi:hypothetical protein
MSGKNGKEKLGMTDFELGITLSRIEGKVDGALTYLNSVVADFKKDHHDHELRVRKLEQDSASKSDVLKVHERVDALEKVQWKTIIYLALGAGAAGGGAGAIINLIVP